MGKALILCILLIIGTSPVPVFAHQELIAILGSPTKTNPYVFIDYAFSAEGSSPRTTGALTIGTNDFVFVFCSGTGTASTTATPSSTPSNTFTNLTVSFSSGINSYQRAGYILHPNAGSTTFTCTQAGSGGTGFMSTIALHYHYSGAAIGIDTSISNTGTASAGKLTSITFTTTAPDLVIMCMRGGANNIQFSASTIGPNTGNLRGVSSGTPGSANSDAGCADTTFLAAQTGITASIGTTGSGAAAYAMGAFK